MAVLGLGVTGQLHVQLAKARGAEVTGVCSTGKADLVRSLGAAHVVDYTREDFADDREHYDVILDIAGNTKLSRLRRALTPAGTLVLVGGEEGNDLTGGTIGRQLWARTVSLFVRQHLTSVLNKESGSELERLTPLIEAGQVTPSIDRTFPLAEAADAMRHFEAGRVRGKVAIVVRPARSAG